LERGNIVVLVPGQRCYVGPTDDQTWDELYIQFSGPVFEPWFAAGVITGDSPIRTAANMDEAASHLYMWMIRFLELDSKPKQMRAIAALASFFAEMVTSNGITVTKSDTWLDRAKSLLTQDMKDDLSMKRVAKELGMGYEAFRKRFQANAGTSPMKYRNSQRIEAAKHLIDSNPGMSNKELAAALGFADEYHFSKRFTQTACKSPRGYRGAK
jgi:AraC-like DNA-binding protein